jgi:hypothetical protein
VRSVLLTDKLTNAARKGLVNIASHNELNAVRQAILSIT